MKKQTIYTVSTETNLVIRASRTLLAAYEFMAANPDTAAYLCTSEFNDLKKGQTISNIEDFIA